MGNVCFFPLHSHLHRRTDQPCRYSHQNGWSADYPACRIRVNMRVEVGRERIPQDQRLSGHHLPCPDLRFIDLDDPLVRIHR